MAPKQPGGLQGFVKGRNQHDTAREANAPEVKVRGSNDDLKVPVKGGSKKNTTATANSQAPRTHVPRTRSQSHDRTQPPPFYGTDASNADGTSTTGSTRQQYPPNGQTQGPRPRSQAQNPQQPQSESGSEESGSDESDNGNLSTRLLQASRNVTHSAQAGRPSTPHTASRKPDGSNLPRLEGDSYPDTTSGRLSTEEQDNRDRPAALQPQGSPVQPTYGSLPTRGGGTRVPLPQQYPANGGPQQANQTTSVKHPYELAAPGDVLDDINNTFSFAKPGAPKFTPGRAAPTQPRVKPQVQSQAQPATTNAAQRGSTTTEPQSARHRQPAQYGPHPASPESQLPQRVEDQKRHKSSCPSPEQLGMPSEADNFGNNDMLRHGAYREPSPAREPLNVLDYPPEELYSMGFHELKAKTFDMDPIASNFSLPEDQQNNTLQEKLLTVANLKGQNQAAFLETLTIEQWEEAGDWFLGRFSEVSKRMKSARQEKRKATREFEGEIEQRHEAVFKKQKLTEGALSDMKESGGKVLQGTPKKTKKTR